MATGVVDLLERPVYGFRQADRVLGLADGTTARWVDGYRRGGKSYPPVVREHTTGDELVTWGEFVEVRLLAEFRDARVPMLRLRPTVERLREELGVTYPLAHSRTWLQARGREVVRQVQQGLGSPLQFTVVRSGQHQLDLAAPATAFVGAINWGPDDDDIAVSLSPVPGIALVVCDPLRQVGEPTVKGILVDVLTEQVRVGEPLDSIAEVYGLETYDVLTAVRYELVRSDRETEPLVA